MGNGAGKNQPPAKSPQDNSKQTDFQTDCPQVLHDGGKPARSEPPRQPVTISPATGDPAKEALPPSGGTETDAPAPSVTVSDPLPDCLKFLASASSKGGKTVRRSPGDAGAFLDDAGRRRDLRPAFLRALVSLRDATAAGGGFTDNAGLACLLTVCKMSDLTDPSLADELVGQGFPELFANIWRAVHREDVYTAPEMRRQYAALNLLKQASVSFTHVGARLCAAMGSAEHGLVALMAGEFRHPLMGLEALKDGTPKALWDSPRETLKKTVSLLANIIRGDVDSKPVFREAGLVARLQALLECRFMIMRAKALFCLVYLINEDENEALSTTGTTIEFVIKVLGKCLKEQGHYSEHYTFSAEVVVDGIVFLGLNDSNKVKLVEKGVLPQLITMLKTNRPAERRSAARAVWRLAFHEKNKALFKSDESLIEVLKELCSSESDESTVKACRTVLWMLDVATDGDEHGGRPTTGRRRPRTAKSSEKGQSTADGAAEAAADGEDGAEDGHDADDDDLPHVMISYQWGVQTQMVKVKELLRLAGFNVWMDVDDMGGSTLESMASAVERSAVVLVCFTEKYKRSPSCRTEAEYTYKLQKAIVPLRLQEDYDPDGWLGIMIGTKLYVDLSRTDMLEEGMTKLIQQLGDKGKLPARNDLKSTGKKSKVGDSKSKDTASDGKGESNTARSVKKPPLSGSSGRVEAREARGWTADEVGNWLDGHGLGGLRDRFHGYTGRRLLGLKAVAAQAPDFFFAELRRDLGLQTLLEVVAFKQALDEIT